jgi:hypothetical protein
MTEPPRTVQSYIDQTPASPDGTPTDFLIATSVLGAWITWQFRIETTGVPSSILPRQTGEDRGGGRPRARRRPFQIMICRFRRSSLWLSPSLPSPV